MKSFWGFLISSHSTSGTPVWPGSLLRRKSASQNYSMLCHKPSLRKILEPICWFEMSASSFCFRVPPAVAVKVAAFSTPGHTGIIFFPEVPGSVPWGNVSPWRRRAQAGLLWGPLPSVSREQRASLFLDALSHLQTKSSLKILEQKHLLEPRQASEVIFPKSEHFCFWLEMTSGSNTKCSLLIWSLLWLLECKISNYMASGRDRQSLCQAMGNLHLPPIPKWRPSGSCSWPWAGVALRQALDS